MSAAIDIYVNPWMTGQAIVANSLGGLSAGSGAQGALMPKLAPAYMDQGLQVKQAYCTFLKGTESDGTIYRLFRSLPGTIIPISIALACSAIAGLTSVSCGLYKTGQVIPGGPIGTAANASACFASAVDIHLGAASFKQATAFDMLALGGMSSPNNLYTRFYEYASQTVINNQDKFDVALTCTTAGVNTGWIAVLFNYVQG